MTDDLLQAVRDLPKCSPYLHVPAQSGSNAVLKRMKRGYTVEDYREMMSRIRATIPDAAVTSDFIVGFCGETEDEFQQTVELVRQSRFKNSFIFKYSERPGTKAPDFWPDDVPEEIKRRRNNELLAVQNAISEEDSQQFIGRTVEVLVEGPSKHAQKFDRTDEPEVPGSRHPSPLPRGEGARCRRPVGPTRWPHAVRSNCCVRRQPPANWPDSAGGDLRLHADDALRLGHHAREWAGSLQPGVIAELFRECYSYTSRRCAIARTNTWRRSASIR